MKNDLYLDYRKFYERLHDEYIKYGKLIIAVDFDDTIYDTYKRGEEYFEVIDVLQRWQNHAQFILWSCSLPERYPSMIEYCASRGLRVDAINENVQPIKYSHLDLCKKIYANVYLDDRAGLSWGVQALKELITKIERGWI